MNVFYPGQHRQLFLDHGSTDLEERITRRMHQPKKCGPLTALPGFWVPKERPPPITGNHTRQRVTFKNQPYLHQASLYSFWIE